MTSRGCSKGTVMGKGRYDYLCKAKLWCWLKLYVRNRKLDHVRTRALSLQSALSVRASTITEHIHSPRKPYMNASEIGLCGWRQVLCR